MSIERREVRLGVLFFIILFGVFQISCDSNRHEIENSHHASSSIAQLFESQIGKQFEYNPPDSLYVNFLRSFESGLIQPILFDAMNDSIPERIYGLSDFEDIWTKKSFSFDGIEMEEIITGNGAEENEIENPEPYVLNFQGDFISKLNQSNDEVLHSILRNGEQIVNNLSPSITAAVILSSYEEEEIVLSKSMKDFIAAHLYGSTVLQMHDYVTRYAEN